MFKQAIQDYCSGQPRETYQVCEEANRLLLSGSYWSRSERARSWQHAETNAKPDDAKASVSVWTWPRQVSIWQHWQCVSGIHKATNHKTCLSYQLIGLRWSSSYIQASNSTPEQSLPVRNIEQKQRIQNTSSCGSSSGIEHFNGTISLFVTSNNQ